MSALSVVVKLNQQQLELLDRTVDEVGAPGRAELLVHALREYSLQEAPPSSG